MPPRDPWSVLVSTIVDLKPAPPKPERFNPRPPGVIRAGSTTELVLVFLRARAGRFHRHHEIVAGVARSKVAVDWALAFLRDQHLVESIPDPMRNSRYLRYRARPTTDQAGAPTGQGAGDV